MAPRCTLRHLFTAPGVEVTGYDARGVVELPAGGSIVIGRLTSCRICIGAQIGGRNTFFLAWSAPSWVFQVKNEWALAKLNAELLPGFGEQERFPQRALQHGDVIEIFSLAEVLVHRFGVELA